MRLIPPRITEPTMAAQDSPIMTCIIEIFDSLPSIVNEFVAIRALSGPVMLNICAYNC